MIQTIKQNHLGHLHGVDDHENIEVQDPEAEKVPVNVQSGTELHPDVVMPEPDKGEDCSILYL